MVSAVSSWMNQILCCDWLPERESWRQFECSRFTAVFRKKIVFFLHIIKLALWVHKRTK